MSKGDAQRAMREAKFARSSASGAGSPAPTPVAKTAAPAAAKPKAKPAQAAKAAPAAAAPEGARCGHKSMSGRTCTREAAHSEKSHRYS